MSYLKKVKCYLELLKFKNTSIDLNPTTFSGTEQPLTDSEVLMEEILSEDSMPLMLYQKYSLVEKEQKDKYGYLFSPPEYEWKLVATFCSRFIYDEYEEKQEKLVATPYMSITEEQYQALLASNAKKRGHKNR